MKTHLINLDTKQKKVDLFVKVHHNENHEFAVLLLVSSAVAENCCFRDVLTEENFSSAPLCVMRIIMHFMVIACLPSSQPQSRVKYNGMKIRRGNVS